MSTPLFQAPASPAGFRQNAAGLIVPEALSRAREVWTRDEWKAMDRTAKTANARGLRLLLHCDACAQPIRRLREGDDMVLRCGCKDRVFTKAF